MVIRVLSQLLGFPQNTQLKNHSHQQPNHQHRKQKAEHKQIHLIVRKPRQVREIDDEICAKFINPIHEFSFRISL